MATKGRGERQAAELETAQAEVGAKGAQLDEHADAMAELCGLLKVPAGTDVLPAVRALMDRTALLEETQIELQAARLDLRVRVEQPASPAATRRSAPRRWKRKSRGCARS
jgi:hypothetical protein